MASQKNGRPTLSWSLLRLFVEHGGRIAQEDDAQGWSKVQKQKQLLSGALIELFGIGDDPILAVSDRSYEAQFKVRDSRSLTARARSQR
jgi:hypothetical protein